MLRHIPDPWRAYIELIRLEKPIGTLLLLWPTLTALWLAASGLPDIDLLLIFTVGTLLARSAGCALNDFADRNLDGKVSRTSTRPLATKRIKPKAALWVSALLFLAAFFLVLLTNALTIMLAFGAVAISCCYPFVKRFSHYPQFVLGIAFSWGIPMAFTAQTNAIGVQAWWLLAACAFWTIAYDTEYAMVDRSDDLKANIKSAAIAFGRFDRLIVGLFQVAMLACLLVVARLGGFGLIFALALLISAGLFIYQHMLISKRQPARCLAAFKHNNLVGLTIFTGTVLELML